MTFGQNALCRAGKQRSAVGILGASSSPSVKVHGSPSSQSLPGPAISPILNLRFPIEISQICHLTLPYSISLLTSQSEHLPLISQISSQSPIFSLDNSTHCHVFSFPAKYNLIFECRISECQIFCKVPFSFACFTYQLLPASGVGTGSTHLSRLATV